MASACAPKSRAKFCGRCRCNSGTRTLLRSGAFFLLGSPPLYDSLRSPRFSSSLLSLSFSLPPSLLLFYPPSLPPPHLPRCHGRLQILPPTRFTFVVFVVLLLTFFILPSSTPTSRQPCIISLFPSRFSRSHLVNPPVFLSAFSSFSRFLRASPLPLLFFFTFYPYHGGSARGSRRLLQRLHQSRSQMLSSLRQVPATIMTTLYPEPLSALLGPRRKYRCRSLIGVRAGARLFDK